MAARLRVAGSSDRRWRNLVSGSLVSAEIGPFCPALELGVVGVRMGKNHVLALCSKGGAVSGPRLDAQTWEN